MKNKCSINILVPIRIIKTPSKRLAWRFKRFPKPYL